MKAVRNYITDYHIKKFRTKDQLISMLFPDLTKCTTIREVSGAMLLLSGKIRNFQLDHIPRLSTLSDAYKQRS